MKFNKLDDLGIERTYYGVTEIEEDNEVYIIYSDLVMINDEPRLFVGKKINNKIEDISIDKTNIILDKFNKIKEEYIKKVMEMSK